MSLMISPPLDVLPYSQRFHGLTRSADCWALGILTFEFTAGYTPFQAPGEPSDMTALFTRIAGTKVASTSSIFPPSYDQKARFGTSPKDVGGSRIGDGRSQCIASRYNSVGDDHLGHSTRAEMLATPPCTVPRHLPTR